jgi:hypothetical protein
LSEVDEAVARQGYVIEFPRPLRSLTPQQVMKIDKALSDIGAFGEVRLVKEKGRIRFITTLVSDDFLGSLQR